MNCNNKKNIKQLSSNNLITWLSMTLGFLIMSGCAAPKPSNLVELAPKLTHYSRFELFSQSSTAVGQRATGSLEFNNNSAAFDLHISGSQSVEHLFVQPEACRDDPSPDCKRRFTISGQMTALGTSMSCFIPVRNDTSIGYFGQTLAGICQDRYGRLFTISIYAK